MIDILLPTYNGCKYLEEQLRSIIIQKTKNHWNLLIRDDNSIDLTRDIIDEYQDKYLHKIFLTSDYEKNLGITSNIACLLKNSRSNYIMFCDQDDVWLEDKIEVTFSMMLKMEHEYGKETPILIHTDLQVVDSNLNLINHSFQRHQNIDPNPKKLLPRLLVQNFVTGCFYKCH